MSINNLPTDKTQLLATNPVWAIFDKITRIPRPSKKEERIIAYLVDFAQKRGLECKTDKMGNVLMTAPATPGYETIEPVILQAHVDMVCEKNTDVDFDFLNDAIRYYVEDGWVRACGTTLGADDGIGVALALAIVDGGLKGTVQHGSLFCLFTVDEEMGLTGAENVDVSFLPANRLINLDSENEGQVFIGCAGGCSTTANFELQTEPTEDGVIGIIIRVSGLLGGHSGGDIHLGRGNANKILARFVKIASEKCGFRLSSFNGGNLHNAISREATATGVVPFGKKEDIRLELNCFFASVEEELNKVDPFFSIDLETSDYPKNVLSLDLQQRLINSLIACPNGVISMSQSLENLVQTSTNLSSVKTSDKGVEISTMQRSSMDSEKTYVQAMVSSVFELAKAHVSCSDGYCGWTPNIGSPLMKMACDSYRSLFNTEVKVLAIHAGLECGLFCGKKRSMDAISIGPTVVGVHSPDEAVDIASVDKFWLFLTDMLKR